MNSEKNQSSEILRKINALEKNDLREWRRLAFEFLNGFPEEPIESILLNIDSELQKHEKFISVLGSLGEYLIKSRRFDQSLKIYEKCIAIDPKSEEGLLGYALSTKGLNKHETALKLLQDFVSIYPKQVGGWSNLILCLYEMGRGQEAYEVLFSCMEDDPKNPYFVMIWHQLKISDGADIPLEPGEQDFDSLTSLLLIDKLNHELSKNPENENTLIELGNRYFEINQLENAQDTVEKALNINPSNKDLYRTLAFIEYSKEEKGDYQKITELTKKAIELGLEDPILLGIRGIAFGMLQDYYEARFWLEKAVNKAPNDQFLLESMDALNYRIEDIDESLNIEEDNSIISSPTKSSNSNFKLNRNILNRVLFFLRRIFSK